MRDLWRGNEGLFDKVFLLVVFPALLPFLWISELQGEEKSGPLSWWRFPGIVLVLPYSLVVVVFLVVAVIINVIYWKARESSYKG